MSDSPDGPELRALRWITGITLAVVVLGVVVWVVFGEMGQ